MSRVSGRSMLVVLSAIVALSLPQTAAAEDQPGVEVGGFVDVYYGYNSNETSPGLRTFDVQHNTFSLSLAELNLTKEASSDSRVGLRLDLDFGRTADLTTAFEPGDGDRAVYGNIEQAYLSLLTGKMQWDVGKFVTPIGAEVIESQDNWNYTRSILFGYAIPFYHLGVRATLPVGGKLSLTGHLVNGWNNASELDGQKTFAVGATVTPNEKLTWVANLMVGKEAEALDTRSIFDTTFTLAATEKVSLMVNVDYGKEGEASWWGIGGYAKLQASPGWALVGRFEHIDDTDGGFMTIGTKAQSVTITSDHLVAGDLKARIEYRLDLTDGDFFAESDGSMTDSQSTVTVGLVYGFGGRI